MSNDLAGKLAPKSFLEDIPTLISNFYMLKPDPSSPTQRVSFGTSGHRGSSNKKSFNEDHILAITQAICDFKKEQNINGAIFIGQDTHALSTPAKLTALRVLVANGIKTLISKDDNYTPTPAISHAILTHNKNSNELCDGIVITPSHNPPSDGGFKYNTPDGGPANSDATSWIEDRANEYLSNDLKDIKKISIDKALKSPLVEEFDFISHYVNDLENVIDLKAIKDAGIKMAADCMGGSGMEYYKAIKDRYDLDMSILNDKVDERFSFMHLDHDGKIRMDCSSPYAMAGLVELKDKFDIAFGNDTDFDRHGIVTPSGGLMNPNHYLSVAIWYLINHRKEWRDDLKIGKTVVSSSMIDRVVKSLNRELYEVPVGFKWYVDLMSRGELAFGGEESAGASFLRFDGGAWSSDKDGIILALLSAEILAVTGKNPQQIYDELTKEFGKPLYKRVDTPCTLEQKKVLKKLSPSDIKAKTLAGEEIVKINTNASGNGESIGGLKVESQNGWFAIRPSGTEDLYKIYAESFKDEDHLNMILDDAIKIVNEVF